MANAILNFHFDFLTPSLIHTLIYRVFFLTAPPPPLDWPPQKCFDWPPSKLSKCWNHIHFDRHLGVFRSEGGPVWDSVVFFKSVTYRPTLSKFRVGPVKKNTLYVDATILLFSKVWMWTKR